MLYFDPDAKKDRKPGYVIKYINKTYITRYICVTAKWTIYKKNGESNLASI